jgi:hypothetical protein
MNQESEGMTQNKTVPVMISGKQIKKSLLYILTTLLLVAGCERERPSILNLVDCSQCYQVKPDWVRLNVLLTINSENPSVPIEVYVGNIEEGVLDWQDTADSSHYWVNVVPGRYYSVKAEYKKGVKTIFAVDGDRVKLDYNTSDCDQDCYYQRGGNIDVRLR